MAKGYWIAHVDITDPERFKQYQAANAAPISEFGGQFIVRGGESELRHGTMRGRHVVVEFPTFQAAKACYDSPAYKAACEHRDAASNIDIVIVEGYE